tara:strand:+ start:176 stop:421 length:246 start_codon:yes stop_codon:yes gene_type:complete
MSKSSKSKKLEAEKALRLGSNTIFLATTTEEVEEFPENEIYNKGVAEVARYHNIANDDGQTCLLDILDTGRLINCFGYNSP